jgi:Spy/CpxP family protein refolding chaperone
MLKKFTLSKSLIVAAVLLLAGTLVFAGAKEHRKGHGKGCGNEPCSKEERVEKHADRFTERLLRKVDATEEQRRKINAIKEKLLPELATLSKERGDTLKEALALFGEPTADGAKLDALVDRKADEMRALGHKLAAAAVEVHAVLAPEQRQKLMALAEKRCD